MDIVRDPRPLFKREKGSNDHGHGTSIFNTVKNTRNKSSSSSGHKPQIRVESDADFKSSSVQTCYNLRRKNHLNPERSDNKISGRRILRSGKGRKSTNSRTRARIVESDGEVLKEVGLRSLGKNTVEKNGAAAENVKETFSMGGIQYKKSSNSQIILGSDSEIADRTVLKSVSKLESRAREYHGYSRNIDAACIIATSRSCVNQKRSNSRRRCRERFAEGNSEILNSSDFSSVSKRQSMVRKSSRFLKCNYDDMSNSVSLKYYTTRSNPNTRITSEIIVDERQGINSEGSNTLKISTYTSPVGDTNQSCSKSKRVTSPFVEETLNKTDFFPMARCVKKKSCRCPEGVNKRPGCVSIRNDAIQTRSRSSYRGLRSKRNTSKNRLLSCVTKERTKSGHTRRFVARNFKETSGGGDEQIAIKKDAQKTAVKEKTNEAKRKPSEARRCKTTVLKNVACTAFHIGNAEQEVVKKMKGNCFELCEPCWCKWPLKYELPIFSIGIALLSFYFNNSTRISCECLLKIVAFDAFVGTLALNALECVLFFSETHLHILS